MYFQAKNTLKNNTYHILKHLLKLEKDRNKDVKIYFIFK
jgi:hypothetical protein